MTIKKITEEDIKVLQKRVEETYMNAHYAGKEGAGTHRNAGDSGRVAALWLEARKELQEAIKRFENEQ